MGRQVRGASKQLERGLWKGAAACDSQNTHIVE